MKEKTYWIEKAESLGPEFAQRAVSIDDSRSFVSQNYEEIKSHGLFKILIPEELGGGGADIGCFRSRSTQC